MSQPVETTVVTFFEHPVLTVRSNDGFLFLSLRDLCDATGLSFSSQLRRVRAHQILSRGFRTFVVPAGNAIREQAFLQLEFVATWIGTINQVKAAVVVQERLYYLAMFGVKHVYDVIARAAGLPGGTSAHIEDIHELEKFDDAMTRIADWQRQVEESLQQRMEAALQEKVSTALRHNVEESLQQKVEETLQETLQKLRAAWREQQLYLRTVDERVQNLEEHLGVSGARTITRTQRGVIYHMVQAWALARVEHEQKDHRSAFQQCWSAIKARYQVAKYEHLPSDQYEDCVAFIRGQYRQLTGEDLIPPAEEE